jgi:hypothetical protein
MRIGTTALKVAQLHAHNVMKVARIRGDFHSTPAEIAHRAVAAELGREHWAPDTSPGLPLSEGFSFDDRFGQYSDPILPNKKSEKVEPEPSMPPPSGDSLNKDDIGGEGSHLADDQFDPNELQMGIDTEMQEHNMDLATATKVAKDHLLENPRYYSQELEKQDVPSTHKDLHLPVGTQRDSGPDRRTDAAGRETIGTIKINGPTQYNPDQKTIWSEQRSGRVHGQGRGMPGFDSMPSLEAATPQRQ